MEITKEIYDMLTKCKVLTITSSENGENRYLKESSSIQEAMLYKAEHDTGMSGISVVAVLVAVE